MYSETELIQKRGQLRDLIQRYPSWSNTRLQRMLGMSISWIAKWRCRLQQAPPDDERVLHSRSRRRITSPRLVTAEPEAKVLHYRETLTLQYHRRVGARNILYHLQQDTDLQQLEVYIPRSPTTVHAVLQRYQRIPKAAPRLHIPLDRPAPLQVWEIDFKEITTARSEHTDKQQHQVEALNVIDTGTSIALANPVSDRFDAEWTLIAMVDILRTTGLPRVIRLDRDPRFVSSWGMDQFPSAFMRFLLCLGIIPDICPPQRPDRKPFIERFNRTQQQECIDKRRPEDVVNSQLALDDHRQFYNLERPNQAITCGNKPPSIALGDVPPLPRLPVVVDPDAWLWHFHRQSFKRRVRSNGSVTVDSHRYYIGRRFVHQQVLLQLNAQTKQFDVQLRGQVIKHLDIGGLYHGQMEFVDYVDFIVQEAVSEARRLQHRRRRLRTVA